MLKALVSRLICPTCLDLDKDLTAQIFTDGTDGHIHDGVLICQDCHTWYPIEEGVLELVKSSMLEPNDNARFCARFTQQLSTLGLLQNQNKLSASQSEAEFSAQLKQRQHFDWYAENSEQTYNQYQASPFWVAVDEITFKRWNSYIKPESWILDVGCADGRSAFPLVRDTATVIGFDISKNMVKKAIERAKSVGAYGTTSFFVADADHLPFKDEVFDYIVIYGVLHHLPNPETTCRDVQRILKKGGIYFGSENNKSMFRGIFDFMMKLLPLWTEEAGEEPLISTNMILDWNKGLAVQIRHSSSVFLPPHLFNLVGKKIARPMLAASDQLFSLIPGLRNQGGLIVFEIRRL